MSHLLPNLSIQIIIRFLQDYGYKEHSKDKKYLHFIHEDSKNLLTIPINEKIGGKLLESILAQASVSKIEFVEKIKSYNKLSVKPSAIALIDILGFQEKMKELDNNVEKMNEYVNKLNSTVRNAYPFLEHSSKRARKYRFSKMCYVRVFSDNLIFMSEVTERDGEAELADVINEIAAYQLSLAIDGFFSRGATTYGNMYCDDLLLIGQPIVDAHLHETNNAIFPRIILDDSIIKKLYEYSKYYAYNSAFSLFRHLIKDSDGYWFVNYLYDLKLYNDDMNDWFEDDNGYKYFPETIRCLNSHKSNILENMNKYKDNTKIYTKYEWLVAYHNFFCSEYFSNEKELLINSSADKFSFSFAHQDQETIKQIKENRVNGKKK